MNIKSTGAKSTDQEAPSPRPPETLPIEPVEDESEDNEFYTPDSDDQQKISSVFSSSADTVAIDSIQLTTTVTEEHPLTCTGNEEGDEEQCPKSTQQSQLSVEESSADLNANSQKHLSNQRQLTPELIIRAEKEVNEKDSWRLRDIEALRDMLLGKFRKVNFYNILIIYIVNK